MDEQDVSSLAEMLKTDKDVVTKYLTDEFINGMIRPLHAGSKWISISW